MELTLRRTMRGEDKKQSSMLMPFYSVRSERQFCEQLDYNRDRLIIHDAAGEFLGAIVEQARTRSSRTPHVAQNITKQRGSNIDGRTTNPVGNFRKTRLIGLGANQVAASMLASAYNLLRMANLLQAA